MTRSIPVVSLFFVLVAMLGAAAQSSNPTGLIGPPRVRSFPKMDYPVLSRNARVQGAVVVRATLTANGAVSDAIVLSGMPTLNEVAVAHAKQVTFANAGNGIILVYLFEIDGACTGPDTFFRWGNAPNVIRITTCSALSF